MFDFFRYTAVNGISDPMTMFALTAPSNLLRYEAGENIAADK